MWVLPIPPEAKWPLKVTINLREQMSDTGDSMEKMPITASNLRIRKSFAKNKQVIDIPNLIELQKSSYEAFLQKDVDADRRGMAGLNGVFKSVFPISDFNNTASLEFVSYQLE